MTAQDQVDVAAFLTCGFFVAYPEEFRAAASLEMDRQRSALELERSLERYRQTDPVFSGKAE